MTGIIVGTPVTQVGCEGTIAARFVGETARVVLIGGRGRSWGCRGVATRTGDTPVHASHDVTRSIMITPVTEACIIAGRACLVRGTRIGGCRGTILLRSCAVLMMSPPRPGRRRRLFGQIGFRERGFFDNQFRGIWKLSYSTARKQGNK